MVENEIPNYITSRSLRRLRGLMIENNIKKKMTFHYFDIQQAKNVKGQLEWVAFYYEKLSDNDIISEDDSKR